MKGNKGGLKVEMGTKSHGHGGLEVGGGWGRIRKKKRKKGEWGRGNEEFIARQRQYSRVVCVEEWGGLSSLFSFLYFLILLTNNTYGQA